MLNQHLHQRQQLLQLGWALWVLKWVDWLFELAGTSLMAIQLTRKLTYSMQRFSHINAAPMFPEDILLRRTPAPNRSYVTQDDSWQLKSWCNAAFFFMKFPSVAFGSAVYAISANVNKNAGYGNVKESPFPSLFLFFNCNVCGKFIPRQPFTAIIVVCVRTWDISQKFPSLILRCIFSPFISSTHTSTKKHDHISYFLEKKTCTFL